MVLRMIVGLVLTVAAFAIAGRRFWWLKRLAFSGQPAPERLEYARSHPGREAETQLTEVVGQRKLLQWSVPGAAHAATFWGFIVLLLTIIEAYGDLFSRTFAIPGIGHWAAIGFLEDLFSVGVLCGLATFTVIRLRSDPHKEGRRSRFFGSHTRAAWVVLAMITAVIITLLLYRGAQQNTGVFPYPHAWAFASWVFAKALHPLGYGVNSVLEVVFLLAQLGVVLAFLVIVAYSKHLHIFLAPVNIMFSRRPNALGPLEPMRSNGKVLDFEEADPDTDVFGIGKVEDMTWKGLLDLGTCTECGRCQSKCPAWATDKPLSPKQIILDLRDHAFAKAPYLLATEEEREHLPADVLAEAGRPLVGGADVNGVIDPEALWACTNCGACVEECPVDIEHIDHINGMRRHQVLVESAFPTEATGMLNNLERRGNPWGMAEDRRADWITELDFEVPVLDGRDPRRCRVPVLGRLRRARLRTGRRRPPRPSRSCCTSPGSSSRSWARPRPAPATPPAGWATSSSSRCSPSRTWRPSTRPGSAPGPGRRSSRPARTASTPSAASTPSWAATTRSYTTPSCWPSWSRTASSPRSTRSTRRSPTTTRASSAATTRSTPRPAQIIDAVPGTQAEEMHRCKGNGFCCGAGGARMWLEERTGTRINNNRIDEALALNPDTVSTACPYCMVMLGDAVNAKKATGEAKESLEVIDVAQLLVRSVRLRDERGEETKA